jgi:PAS domain S-box-containing protein
MSFQLLNACSDPAFLFPVEGEGFRSIAYCNDAALTRYGYSRQEFGALELADISCEPEMISAIERAADGSRQESGLSVFYTSHRDNRGCSFPVEIRSSIVELEPSSYHLLIVKDLSDQADLKTALAQSEEKFQATFHASPDAITLTSLDEGVYYEVNEAFSRILGYQAEEVIGRSSYELNIWSRNEDRIALVAQLGEKGFVDNQEVEFSTKGHSPRIGLVSARIFEFQGRRLIVTITRDITERKQAEEELRLMHFALDRIDEEVHLVDSRGRILYANHEICKKLGYGKDELLEMGSGEFASDLTQEEKNEFLRSSDGTMAARFENVHTRRDGSSYPVDVALNFFEYSGETYGLLLSRDISERNRIEEEMERLHFALDHVADEVQLIDNKGCFAYVNQQTCRATGYTRAELIGMEAKRVIVSGAPGPDLDQDWDELWASKTSMEESVQQHRDGSTYPVEILKTPFIYGGSRYGLVLARNIEDRKKADKEMKLMTFALDHIDEEVHLSDDSGTFVYVNQQACKALGYSKEELLGMQVRDINPETLPGADNRSWLKDAKSFVHETRHKSKDGQLYPVEVTANHFEYDGESYNLALARDITERLKFEKQMLQAQKFESLGVLAGGVAHDFNNLIVAILGHAELTRRLLREDSLAVKSLTQIEIAAERAADLAKQMLAYSGKGTVVVEPIDLNSLLMEIQGVLRVTIPKNVSLQLGCHEALPAIDADATQIRQVVMNLILNASEAIGDAAGSIFVSTRCGDCTADDLPDSLPAGRYVSLEVTDSGCGMDEETLSKLFDPFFTTKFTGRGLGMSAVQGIVHSHKGAIVARSQKGEGTTFRVLLPASEKKVVQVKTALDDGWRGTGTVLVVDDEDIVRNSCSAMLAALGFTVVTAKDGLEALQVFKETPHVRLVFLDLMMPNLDGEKCFYAMRNIDPDVRVILSSGYSESEVSQRFVDNEVNGFLQKPYRLAFLNDALRKALVE